jgi:hypothetical protein
LNPVPIVLPVAPTSWLHRKEDAFPTLTMRDEIAVVRHIDKGILTGAIGTCLISI